VRNRLGECFVVIALILSIGGHWTLLQSVAWMGMFAHNVRSCTLAEALDKTFDGQHPCALCKVVAAGKKSEQKQPLTKLEVKIDFWLAPSSCLIVEPTAANLSWPPDSVFSSRAEAPPTPPPRLV